MPNATRLPPPIPFLPFTAFHSYNEQQKIVAIFKSDLRSGRNAETLVVNCGDAGVCLVKNFLTAQRSFLLSSLLTECQKVFLVCLFSDAGHGWEVNDIE